MNDLFQYGSRKIPRTPEGKLFDACARLAAADKATAFTLTVSEPVSIISTVSAHPTLIELKLDLSVTIPVLPYKRSACLSLLEYTFEGSDASTAKRRTTRMVAAADVSAVIRTDVEKHVDPLDYMRKTVVQWATETLEAQIEDGEIAANASPEDLQDSLGWIGSAIELELRNIRFYVDEYGDFEIARRMDVMPTVTLAESPIMGASSFFNLIPPTDGSEADWAGKLLSFPVTDIEGASAVRDALVAAYCPRFDPDYGNDWLDSALMTDWDMHATGKAVLGGAETTFKSLSAGLGLLADALFSAGVVDSRYLFGGRPERTPVTLATLAEDVSQNAEAFKAFLSENGWSMPFDPLELASLKLRRVLGLPLDLEPILSPKEPSAGPAPR